MRDRATKHFNTILVAYETLNNPHKRIVYDRLGIEGLKDRTWQVGVRSMNPTQFKFWLEEHMRKQKVEMLDELVMSTGKVVTTIDISGFWFQKMVVAHEKGRIVSQSLESYPIFQMTRYHISHSFQFPMDTLGEILETPFENIWKTDAEKPLPRLDNQEAPRSKPMLSFDFSLGGAQPDRKKKSESFGPRAILAGTGLNVNLVHNFPSLPPDAPRSIGTLLAGNQVAVTGIVLPVPMLSTQITRPFGQNALTTRATFIGLPSLTQAPVVECNLVRRLAIRHSVHIGIHTGSTKWLANLSELFKLPALGTVRNGHASMGYIYQPISSPTESQDGSEEDETSNAPHISSSTRSKRSEAYGVVITSGLQAGGIQAKLTWGRTFFVGTPFTMQTRTPRLNPAKAHQNVGVRLGAEASIYITGAAHYTLKATRKVLENTIVGVTVSMGSDSGGEAGVVLGLTWSRLGQKFSVPVILAPIPNTRFLMYATAAPVLTYIVTELLWLRPRERKLREQEAARMRRTQRSKTLRRRRAAEEAAEIMRPSVERKMEAERASGGLVVLSATWGKAAKNGDSNGLVADVTIALSALVEQGQLVLPTGVDKSKIIGFYDPAPGSEKVLTVRYLFRGVLHEAAVKGRAGLAVPMKRDVVSGQ